ncbi:MAG: elongation factor Ts [Ignavibacteriales bacterium CG12_big_fil_rev_8_21_14_0_65_30_8]|nr:MAG: elongation factor Ts [Ignavibacteriales bacterium CG12_big_fil_rev_8_21_14_0_65_30_8]
MGITASQVNELRKKTGAGMMDCKKALTEANGDMEKAIELLRKKGTSVAAKRAEKSATEGLVLTKVSDDKRAGTILEINCETDFVAKGNDFTSFANSVLEKVYTDKPDNTDTLLKDDKVKNSLTDLMGKVGEKIEISRFVNEQDDNGMFIDYVHMGAKLGVLLKLGNVKETTDELNELGRDIAMQIAAMKPICVKRDEVPKEIVDKEIEIYKEISRKEGKPEQILDKITTGKLNKYYQENCLIEQAFIKDNTKSVGKLIEEYNSRNKSKVNIVHFHRLHLSDENK